MSKSKKKAKAKSLLPKRVAGVKVPKAVRRSRFGQMLASPAGQALLTDLAVGAGALAVAKGKDNPRVRHFAHDAKDKVVHTGEDATHGAHVSGETVAYALREAARAFSEAMHRGAPHEPRSFAADAEAETWTPDYGAPEPAAAADQGKASRKKQPTAQDVSPL